MSESKVPLPRPTNFHKFVTGLYVAGLDSYTEQQMKEYGDARAAERDAEITRLVDALREAMPYVEQHQSRLHGGLLIRIDALLREYPEKP